MGSLALPVGGLLGAQAATSSFPHLLFHFLNPSFICLFISTVCSHWGDGEQDRQAPVLRGLTF